MIFNFMKKNLEKTILEMFGDPIEPKMGTKIGDVPGITTVGAVGVRDLGEDSMGEICPDCGMMSINGMCGCGSSEQSCESCGLPVSECQCKISGVCPACGMMAPQIEQPCMCAMTEGKKKNKGPSKKTAKKILKGADTFAKKMEKVSGWAENPAAAAAWMMHKATGKWPQEK